MTDLGRTWPRARPALSNIRFGLPQANFVEVLWLMSLQRMDSRAIQRGFWEACFRWSFAPHAALFESSVSASCVQIKMIRSRICGGRLRQPAIWVRWRSRRLLAPSRHTTSELGNIVEHSSGDELSCTEGYAAFLVHRGTCASFVRQKSTRHMHTAFYAAKQQHTFFYWGCRTFGSH